MAERSVADAEAQACLDAWATPEPLNAWTTGVPLMGLDVELTAGSIGHRRLAL